MAKNNLSIIYLYADSPSEWNCSEWRAKIPSDALNAENAAGRSPHQARLFHMPTALMWDHPAVQQFLGMADAIVFQRNVLIPEVWEAMDYWRAVGKVVTVDLDDSYPQLPPSNPAHTYWIRNQPDLSPEPVEALAEGMRHADALTSPSKVILKDWEYLVPGYWLPNWTRRAWYQPLAQKPIGAPDIAFHYGPPAEEGKGPTLVGEIRPESEGWIVIGWGGSISHLDSWLYSGVIEALDRLFEKRPEARLKFCGNELRLDTWLDRWGDRVVRQEGVRPEHWPQVVATFDIGIAPLDLRPLPPWSPTAMTASYDERRSWLKAVEYLSAGVAWIGSDSLTYGDLRRHGRLVDNTPEAWLAALEHKIEYLEAEKRLAWDKRSWALRRLTMEANVNEYAAIFNRIAAEKASQQNGRLPGITYVAEQ